MALRYSCPSKEKGFPSRRILRSDQSASGSELALVAGLVSSESLLFRYPREDSEGDPFPCVVILHMLLHGREEEVDEEPVLGLGLGPNGFLSFSVYGQPLCQPLSLLGTVENGSHLL